MIKLFTFKLIRCIIQSSNIKVVGKLKEWTTDIFAKNLRYFLELSGKNQKELAKSIGVSAPTVNEWCKGKKTPRMDKVERLTNFFNISISDLIDDKPKVPVSELSAKKRAFIAKVEGMTEAQLERLEQILALVENTEQ